MARHLFAKSIQDAKQPSVKLDMTTLYKDQASSVFRTFKLLNDYTIEIIDKWTYSARSL